PGEASLNLLRLVREDLLFSLRKTVGAAIERNEPVHETGVRLEDGGHTREIGLRVLPITDAKTRYFVVLFEESQARAVETALPAAGPPSPAGSPEIQLQHA